MLGNAPVLELTEAYEDYVDLLSVAGHGVKLPALARHLAGGEEQAAAVEAALRSRTGGGQIDRTATERMQTLLHGLIREMREPLGEAAPEQPAALREALTQGSLKERDAAADAVLLNGHRQFLQPSTMSAGELRGLLAEREAEGDLAMVKVVPHVQRELARRGVEASEAEIGRWFAAEDPEERVPGCLRTIAGGLGAGFRTGLVALEEMVRGQDPDEWLEQTRSALRFRSHSSMHKAIAEATSLKYDCVHKALSGRKKAKRIQAEIKYCLELWLREQQAGRDPGIPEEYLGVPVKEMHGLMARLENLHPTKEDVYRLISERTGIKTGSVRRYFQNNGQLKYAPPSVFRCAAELAAQERPVRVRDSYLSDPRTRQLAEDLAHRANEALSRWNAADGTAEHELAFKETRRALIVTLKERRSRMPVLRSVG